MDQSFKILIRVPKEVLLKPQKRVTRDAFYSWLWGRFSTLGLLGVHEGTLLSEDAAREGFETDSWTVDSAEAPRERDWVSSQTHQAVELYFSSQSGAQTALKELQNLKDLETGEIRAQKNEDWDAQWRASYQGASIEPFWKVIPFWEDPPSSPAGSLVYLKLNPGAGFGTGTHETTQLCLKAIGEAAKNQTLRGSQVLDFGSGSGILAIGAALLGARVDAVEIDPLAIQNAKENAEINSVQERILYASRLESLPVQDQKYDLVIANILRPVLLEFAPELTQRLRPTGRLILSGLIDQDVEPVLKAYLPLLPHHHLRSFELGEWRSVVGLPKN